MINKEKFLTSIALGCLFLTKVYAADIAQNTARLQAMDKITGRVSEIDVPVNGLANYGTFSILVRKCVTKSAEETPENTAFIDIVDNYQTDHPVNIFKGWMFSSSPALNAVEHPIYDVWLLQCFNTKHSKENLLTEDQLALRDTIEMKRPPKHEISMIIGNEQIEEQEAETTEQPVAETLSESTDETEQFASEGEEFEETAESSLEINEETEETEETEITKSISEVINIKE